MALLTTVCVVGCVLSYVLLCDVVQSAFVASVLFDVECDVHCGVL